MNIATALQALKDTQKAKGHGERTIKNYGQCVKLFLTHINHMQVFDNAKMQRYFLHLIDKHNMKPRTVNLHQDALRYFCFNVIKKYEWMLGITHMRTNKPLARVHSKEEIYAMIDATKNPKHRLLLAIAYGCGLRVCEVVTLRVADFNWHRMMVRINDNAKGQKHREIPLFDCRELFNIVTHGQGALGHVFSGQFSGAYSVRSAEKDYVHACIRVGVVPTGFHTLRHSYITHLLEAGSNTKTIADLVGHSSVRTTEGYAHLSRRYLESVKSPMSDFGKTEHIGQLSEVSVG